MDTATTKKALVEREMARRTLARRHFQSFMQYMHPELSMDRFHETYYEILDLFAHGKIKKLIITCPPQHGKSEGSTRNLPAYLHGLDPDLRICITSYGFPLAQKFNRAVQANITSKKYDKLFPRTIMPKTPKAQAYKGKLDLSKYPRNSREYQLIDAEGSLLAVGRGGALTGNPVDIGIIDDLYKDDMEANSPIVRAAAKDWYTDVFSTRLHNDSRQLITFTRWHEDDLIGYLREVNEKEQTPFIPITDLDMFSREDYDPDRWYIINFEAIKETGVPTPVDPRETGELLWPERHGLQKLMDQRKLNPGRFMSLYQGNPMPREGLLYSHIMTYKKFPAAADLRGTYMYVDVADQGSDNLCAVTFGEKRSEDKECFVKNVIYTPEGVDVTEDLVVDDIIRYNVKMAWIESNNGGNGFATHVKQKLKKRKSHCMVRSFYQGANKEARIITAATDVMSQIVMPEDWAVRWPVLYKDVCGFKRLFKANVHDDGPDALTGCTEVVNQKLFTQALYQK